MFENMSEIPVTIMAILITIKIFLDYLAKIKDNKKGPEANNQPGAFTDGEKKVFYDMAKKVDDLYDWHNKEDTDGRKVWYTPSSHEKALHTLNETMVENTNVLRDLKGVIEHIEGS